MNKKTFFNINGLFLFLSIFFILAVSTIVSLAQIQENTWAKIYESSTDNVRTYDKATSIIKASDGNYLIAGFTKLYLGKKIISNLAILKIDTYGNIIWSTKTIEKGNPGFKAEIIALKDGGYAVVYAQFLIRLDKDGNILWIKKFGENRASKVLEFTSIQELDDSGFITCGRSPNEYPTMVMKLDEFGKIIWSKSYFGFISEYARIRKLDDGGFIFGNAISGLHFPNISGNVTQLTKLDADGNIEWEKLYEPLDGSSSCNQGFSTFCLTKNEEIITTIPDGGRYKGCLILKLNLDGDLIWSKLVTHPVVKPITIKDIRCLENGDLILVGGAASVINPGGGGEAYNLNTFVLKMDQNGNILWLKTLGKSPKLLDRNRNQDEYALSVVTNDTGEILYVGTCSSFSGIPDAYNFIGVKMNLDGEVSNGRDYLREVDFNDKRRIKITSPNELDVKEFRNESKEINNINEYDMVDFDFKKGSFTEKNLPKPELKLALSDRGRTLTSNLPIFVKEDEVGNTEIDSDGDGIWQEWEDKAMDYINPKFEFDEDEGWFNHPEHHVVNFVRVFPYTKGDSRYILFNYCVTWSKDYGRSDAGIRDHNGDVERVIMAWEVVDFNQYGQNLQLKYVFTSAHGGANDHSAVWGAWNESCFTCGIAWSPIDDVMCGQLQFENNRLLLQMSEDKHAIYPTEDCCEHVILVAIVMEDCGGGRENPWSFECYNAGEPDTHLIDDLDNPSSWKGLSETKRRRLTNLFPLEKVWSGREININDFLQNYNLDNISPDDLISDNFTNYIKEHFNFTSKFCGGLEYDADSPDPIGDKLKDLPEMLAKKLNMATYQIKVKTSKLGTLPRGEGTDANVYIELFGRKFDGKLRTSGELLLDNPLVNNFVRGNTDTFTVIGKEIGELEYITLRHDNFGPGAAWHCDNIEVKNQTTDTKWTIPVNIWLEKQGDINPFMTFYPQ